MNPKITSEIFLHPNETDIAYHERTQDFFVDRLTRSAHFDMGESHYHPYYELYYLVSGQCRVFLSHTIYYLFPGDLILIPPAILHKTLYETNCEAERITVSFTPEFIRDFETACGIQILKDIFPHQKKSIAPADRSGLMLFFERMLMENAKRDLFTKIQQKSCLYQLLTFLGRLHATEPSRDRLDHAEASIQEAAHFIFSHYMEPLTLKDAAEVAHMSSTYFSRLFKETTGFGFKEYLNQIRLQNAAFLLQSTDASVTEIAIRCGFSDANYFGDSFKKAFHLSPREFRRSGKILQL